MRVRRSATAVALWPALLALGPIAPARGQAPPRPPAFSAVVDSLVPRALAEFLIPGAAVALVRGGEAVWARGYGVADRRSGRAVTPQTAFNVGSMAKSVAAWGVLRLVQDGRVELDRAVDAYLTRWHLPASSFDNALVTTRRLLSHTAGASLPSVTPYDPGVPLPTLEQALAGGEGRGDGVRLDLAPGTQFQYSGGGFDILQLLVEEATGQTFPEAMSATVLRPLGMTRSAFGWPATVEATAATPHNALGEPIPSVRFAELAAAGLQTTVADFARFAAAELTGRGRALPGRGLLRPDLVTLMHSPAPASPRYGLGHEVLRDSATGITFVGHNGANRGWIAVFQIAPASRAGIVVLTNGANGWPLVQQLTCSWERSLGARGVAPYCDRVGVRYVLDAAYVRGGVAEVLSRYETLRQTAADDYDFGPAQLVGLGYDLLHAGRTADAVSVFVANVQRFPADWNSHDSLAEAYLALGDTAKAIEGYRRSVELNPRNTNGADALRRLRGTP